MKHTRIAAPYVLCAAATLLVATQARAADWAKSSPYYEDDAWYDISEWFDGNNYNPTDESFWRWDDERYDRSQDTGADRDNDTMAHQTGASSWYGYRDDNNGDWFYDYYDPATFYDSDGDLIYQYGVRYFDYDDDGAYDATLSFSDLNGDGIYDEYDYHPFTSSTASSRSSDKNAQASNRANASTTASESSMANDMKHEQSVKDQVPRQSRERSVTGTIQNTKQVQVRGDRHLVVQIQEAANRGPKTDRAGQNSGSPSNSGAGSAANGQPSGQQMAGNAGAAANGMIIADLGSAKDLQPLNLAKGDSVTIRGPQSHVGNKDVVLARSIEAKGKTQQVQRQRRQFDGTVTSTHRATVRGKSHLMAMLDVRAPKGNQPGKMVVDFGPAEEVTPYVKDGSKVTFTGVPVDVNGRRLVVAQSIKTGSGQFEAIDLGPQKRGANATPQG